MARITAIMQRKGGVGKSTATAGLAGEFAERAKSVLILDCDRNNTFKFWLNSPWIPPEIKVATIGDSTQLRSAIETQKMKFDEILIDLPAGGSEIMVNAAACADVICVPFRAAPLDVNEAIATRETCLLIAHELRRPPMFIVCLPMMLTMMQWNERITRDAVERLHSVPDLVATHGTTERTAYKRMFDPKDGGSTLYTMPDTVTNVASTRDQMARIVTDIEQKYERHRALIHV